MHSMSYKKANFFRAFRAVEFIKTGTGLSADACESRASLCAELDKWMDGANRSIPLP